MRPLRHSSHRCSIISRAYQPRYRRRGLTVGRGHLNPTCPSRALDFTAQPAVLGLMRFLPSPNALVLIHFSTRRWEGELGMGGSNRHLGGLFHGFLLVSAISSQVQPKKWHGGVKGVPQGLLVSPHMFLRLHLG